MTYYENHKYLASDTAKRYDEILPNYYFFDWEEKKYIEEEVLLDKLIGERKFNNILEFGCGTGRMTAHLFPNTSHYVGVDVSKSMIKTTKSKFLNKNSKFIVSEMNDFINEYENFSNHDFICSFWAFNYAILGFFEYYNLETDEIGTVDDLGLAEQEAIRHIKKVFLDLKKGTEFLFFYFDAYSVEQSYATRIMEKHLPFPHNDRGYTFKVFEKALSQLDLDYKVEYKNGYSLLKNTDYLIGYYEGLHLHGEMKTSEDRKDLIDSFKIYKNEDGSYHIPSGLNIISGIVL